MISFGPLSSTQARDDRDHAGVPVEDHSFGRRRLSVVGAESESISMAGSSWAWRGPPRSHHTGMTSGLSLGNFAMVASLTFRCWATIAGGVRAIQSERETSAKYGALKTSRNCRSVSPVFLM